MRRNALSRPIALALSDGLITNETSVFDYGCGRGDDLRHLRAMEVSAEGWDPAHRPAEPKKPADVVNLGYVINVIEDASERAKTLQSAWNLAVDLLVVSARTEYERSAVKGSSLADGVLTSVGTFQKLYSQKELRDWIDQTLEVRCIAAAPGVFYVFRRSEQLQSFLAARHMRSAPIPSPSVTSALFDQNRDVLEVLMDFVQLRGRLPQTDELQSEAVLLERFGSIKRAFAIVRKVSGRESWEKVISRRREDLLVYLALSRFGGRPRLSELSQTMQWDIRALGGSYRRFCAEGDQLLFQAGNPKDVSAACQQAPVGKLTPDALYVHVSAVDSLPPILRTYEGCARTLAGVVDDATIVKLNRLKSKVSYLAYPEFDKAPHPALANSVVASLSGLWVRVRMYDHYENPPILHRKETFVADDYPGRSKFAKLTRQEERLGLLDDAARIGTKVRWEDGLRSAGVSLRGHRVVTLRRSSS